MKEKRGRGVLLILLLAVASLMGLEAKEPKPVYREGEALVIYRENASASLSTLGHVKYFKALSAHLGKNMALIRSEKSTKALLESLKNNPDVLSASPNYRRQATAIPDDTNFTQLWAMQNTGQTVNGISGTAGADINATAAWDLSTGDSDIVVAVIDTGVNYYHEDLKDNMWVNEAELNGQPGVDDDNNGYVDDIYGYDFAADNDGNNDPDPMDIYGHGTHVSGTIGGVGDNANGVTGVNWRVKIMALKAMRPNLGLYDSDITEAINYILTMKDAGVNIVAVNASYGGYGGSDSDPMKDTIDTLGDAGILFVAAAGNESNDNDGSNPSYPASYSCDNIIAVAATDQNDKLASYSNYGATTVDLGAPGSNILSTVPGCDYTPASGDLFYDDMEKGSDNWSAESPWAITEEEYKSPTHSWSDSPNGDYANNEESNLTLAKNIDLSGETPGDLCMGFWIKQDLEENYDYLYVDISRDGGASWKTVRMLTGTEDGRYLAFKVPESYYTDQFRVRFRIVTDGDTTADGVYIDDVGVGTGTANAYAYYWGTSMATPHVTGAVALVSAYHSDFNSSQIKDQILGTVTPLSSLDGKVLTGGRLNLGNALAGTVSDDNGTADDDNTTDDGGTSSGGGGGGCTYRQDPGGMDPLLLLLMLSALLYYPLRRKKLL